MFSSPRRVTIRGDHGRLAWCDILVSQGEDGDVADVRVHLEPGHLPPTVRRQLVADLVAEVQRTGATRLFVTAPLGDSELLQLLALERCDGPYRVHAAGSTCLIEGDVACFAGTCGHRRANLRPVGSSRLPPADPGCGDAGCGDAGCGDAGCGDADCGDVGCAGDDCAHANRAELPRVAIG